MSPEKRAQQLYDEFRGAGQDARADADRRAEADARTAEVAEQQRHRAAQIAAQLDALARAGTAEDTMQGRIIAAGARAAAARMRAALVDAAHEREVAKRADGAR